MQTPPKLSISLVHHDGLQILRDCLESIRAYPPSVSYEIVIVDNVSTDGAVEMVERDFPEVRLICNTQRAGFGENHNTALRACQGDYLLLLNDDTRVHPGAFDSLTRYLETHPEVALVGPRLLNPDGSLQPSCYRFPTPLRCLWESLLLTAAFPNSPLFGDYRAWAHDSERTVDFVTGAAMLTRRSVLEKAGGFDPLFFMYAEETDWQFRISQKAGKIVFLPDAEITHLGGQSSEGMKDRQFCEFQRSQGKYIRKHYGAIGAFAYRVFRILGAALRLALWIPLSFLPGKRESARQQLFLWSRLLRWWLGLGPREGIAELARSQISPA